MENQFLKNIQKGLKVEIVTKQKKLAKGYIEDIAKREEYNSQGILVRLKTGEIGRVQKIILNEEQLNKKYLIEIEKLVKSGESLHTEFKLNVLWSINYGKDEIRGSKSNEVHEFGVKASKVIVAKSIAAFLNSEGGSLIIGIKEKKEGNVRYELRGLSEDYEKMKDPSADAYRRMLIDEVVRQYFPSKIYNHLNDYIRIEFVEIEGKILCWIKIKKSDTRVFLKLNDKDVFMIRIDSENRNLEGEKLVDYCVKHFKN
ncbi:MAG: putative DNA binding domain-containing protein [Nanoarchaeota archaeon]|nr:putative DNA binding domain-containing protein [Nanoarchaeota archaeon]